MMDNMKHCNELRDETVALLKFNPAYAELVSKYWPLVLTLFCRHQIAAFHNFLSPGTQAGTALMATLGCMDIMNKN